MRTWLKEIRESANLSQTETAKLVGITVQAYNYIENGKRCLPTKCDTEKKIAAELGFDWTRFFEEPE